MSKPFSYPLFSNERPYIPDPAKKDFTCPVCGVGNVGQDGAVGFNFGALAKVGDDAYSANDSSIGFFDFVMYLPEDRHVHLELADAVQGGQGEIIVCSAQCMKDFFSRVVDDLVAKSSTRLS